jgi:hypothetical protein
MLKFDEEGGGAEDIPAVLTEKSSYLSRGELFRMQEDNLYYFGIKCPLREDSGAEIRGLCLDSFGTPRATLLLGYTDAYIRPLVTTKHKEERKNDE